MEQCTCRSSTSWKHGKINNAIARLEALIESASEANVRGDAVSSEEQRNSLIGEQGATALDKAEEATHRMDNLAVARDMEAEGKDAKSIRMATGWERGADGKWRYEIEDIGEIETPDEAIARMGKERKAIEKDRERLDYVVYQRLPRNATEEQKAKMKELRKRHKELVKKSSELWNAIYDKSNSKLGVHLSEYIGNDNELLKAYPELRNIDVSFVENSAMINEGFNGSFNGHTIWINPYAENARSILIHEIQHAIQNIEGFAKGGNNKTADMLRDKARVWAWRNALIHTAKERPELSGTTAVEKALIEEYKEDGLEDYIPSEEQRIKGLNLYLRGYDNEGYEQAYNQMHKVMPREDYTTYRRLAGEVESRNAQKRMDMTAEQRRETLLSETEDVAREDQIFLMENGGVSGMGSTVVKRKADIAMKLKGKDISPTQLKVVDAFATDTNNLTIDVVDTNGKQRSITLKQGQDNKAGVKHSVLKHYETASNYYTAEEILLIPQIIEKGERIQNGNKVSYKAEVNGVKFTVTTEMRRGNEEFTNFFTNRKPINKSLSNTAKQHGTTSQSVSTDKGSEENSDTQENSVKAQYSLQGNSMTEEEQRIVDEAKANGTFDASNPDIRYSLASDMARDAVMTALEGAGIDVEMATPEMVEDVLRARDAEFMSFATSAEEFRNRAKLAKENVGIVAKGLNEINVKIEKVPRHRFKGSGKEAIEKARNWANNNLIGEHTYHKGKVDEFKYQIEPEAVDKFLSSSSTTNSENLGVHLATLTKLVDVIDNSVDAEIHPNYKKINKVRSPKNGIKDDNMLVHRLYGAIEIDNRIYRVKTTIYEVWNDKNKVHDYRITKVELAESVPSTGNAPTNPTFVSGAKLLKNVEKSYDKGKKLLEESEWNPQFHIAYHGSGAKFDEFDHSHMGEGEGAQAYGWGTYLTEVEGIAKGYAKAYDTSQTLGERDWEQLNENIADTLSEEIGIELPIKVGWTGNGFEVFERILRSNYDPNNVMKKEHYEALADYFNYDLDSYEGDYDEFWNEVEYDLIDVATKIAKRLEEEMETPKPMLYTVEIPDDNGSNYLDYDKEMSKKELNEVRNKLEAILAEGDYKGVEKELKRELDSVFVDGLTASDVYGNVSAYLGGDKQASEFFNEMGYVGIKYPANYRSGGNEDGKKNFVIFNDSDMKITDRVEFLQTPDGTVYGWTIGGKIFLTEQGMNAETPIHEYTHLWANAMRRNNEQGWESVKDLLRGTPMWDEVLADKNYSNIHDNEDLVASEVLSRYSGKENAKRL